MLIPLILLRRVSCDDDLVRFRVRNAEGVIVKVWWQGGVELRQRERGLLL